MKNLFSSSWLKVFQFMCIMSLKLIPSTWNQASTQGQHLFSYVDQSYKNSKYSLEKMRMQKSYESSHELPLDSFRYKIYSGVIELQL